MRSRTTAGESLGEIEMLAGDPASAERCVARVLRDFERIHDEAGLSTVAAELADALYVQGRDDEAASWLDLAREARRRRRRQCSVHVATGPGEAAGPAGSDSTRRERSALEAAGLVGGDRCAHRSRQGAARRRRGVAASGSPAEAAAREQALQLFDRKGNVVSGRKHGASVLSELRSPEPHNVRRAPDWGSSCWDR